MPPRRGSRGKRSVSKRVAAPQPEQPGEEFDLNVSDDDESGSAAQLPVPSTSYLVLARRGRSSNINTPAPAVSTTRSNKSSTDAADVWFFFEKGVLIENELKSVCKRCT